MSLLAQLDSDIKDTMRARDADKLMVLRMLKSSMKSYAIDNGLDNEAVDDATFITITRKEMKKRADSIEAFDKGGRPELAAKEKAEAEVLAAYLPKAMTTEDVEALVAAVIAELGATTKAQMGAVMKLCNERAGGRADGKTLSGLVGKLLS